jgi:hypothetical protein
MKKLFAIAVLALVVMPLLVIPLLAQSATTETMLAGAQGCSITYSNPCSHSLLMPMEMEMGSLTSTW